MEHALKAIVTLLDEVLVNALAGAAISAGVHVYNRHINRRETR